jgi:hypothetical protein
MENNYISAFRKLHKIQIPSFIPSDFLTDLGPFKIIVPFPEKA